MDYTGKMIKISSPEQLSELNQENKFIGELPTMQNSNIIFDGSRNILVCEKNVRLVNSTINMHGNDNIVYLCSNSHNYMLNVQVYNQSVFFSGRNSYFNGVLNCICSERKHIFIGNDCLFSFGIWIRVADPHLIYDAQTNRRINPSRSVYIGDHVWIGQDSKILKGTKIHSGSIVGAMSVVAGKEIPSNTSWVGNPAVQKGKQIFWDGKSVHAYLSEQTDESMNYDSDIFTFRHEAESYIPFDEIDNKLSNELPDANAKYDYIKGISDLDSKNRFAFDNSKKKKLFG